MRWPRKVRRRALLLSVLHGADVAAETCGVPVRTAVDWRSGSGLTGLDALAVDGQVVRLAVSGEAVHVARLLLARAVAAADAGHAEDAYWWVRAGQAAVGLAVGAEAATLAGTITEAARAAGGTDDDR